MIETDRRFLYTGITSDLERRLAQHRNGEGAKFFRTQAPMKIVYVERCPSKGNALRREAEIKRLSRQEKQKLTNVRAPRSVSDLVYAWVKRIPRGRVMTYGQISNLLHKRLSARAVGWAMRNSPKGVHWHRVVNASGGCSTDRLPDAPAGLQRHLLESERIVFRSDGTIDLGKYRWVPRKLV
ncbi:MAG: MGMT family protein [Pseudomonadota bacterium]